MNTWKQFVRERPWLLLTAVILLAVLLRWPSLVQPIDNDGGARAYHARLILAGEPLYSTHHTGHHLPAIYYTYATAMSLFGDSNWAIKFFLILWTIPTVYVLYRLGVLVADRNVALLGAAFYAILSAHVNLWGLTAETELFANLPRITAVFVLLYLINREAPSWQYIPVGVISAWAFLYKLIYVSPLLLAFVVIVGKYGRQCAWRQMLGRLVWVGIGFLAGILPVVLYFSAIDLWPRLLLVFTLGQSYGAASDVIPEAIPIFGKWILYPLLPLFGLAFNNAALLIFSLAGFVLILVRKAHRYSLLFYLAIWYALSFVEAGINLELFAHYYLLIVPSLTLLAAWFLLQLVRDLRRSRYGRIVAQSVFLLLLGAALVLSIWRNGPYYFHYLRYRLGQETLAESVRQGWPGFGERLARAPVLADYVEERTNPEDNIYYWSEDVQLYYLSRRRSPIDTIWPIDIEATGPGDRIFTDQTKYIIVDQEREPPPPAWFYDNLAQEYRLETVLAEQAIYRRRE